MDEFVKSVVEHIIGTGRETESIQTQNQENTHNKTIYRPNYQRNKRELGVQPRQQGAFYCVDTEPESKVKFGTAQGTDMLEEDLRWIRLHAKEV